MPSVSTRGSRAFIRLAGHSMVALALLLPALPAVAQEPASYRFDVRIDAEHHTIAGSVTISLSPGDARIRPEWLLLLPPNRFRTFDRRGPRRDLQRPAFDRQVQADDLDPLLPSGFAPSGIDILTAWDPTGPLHTAVESDPHMPFGYSTEAAWLRVRSEDGRPLATVTLRFLTTLPNRFIDGWSNAGLFLEKWYPSLANWSNSAWTLDPDEPRAAVYSGRLASAQAGWLIAGPGLVARASPNEATDLPEEPFPAKSLPIVFLKAGEPHPFALGGTQGVSFSLSGGDRLDRISRSIAARFVEFMQARYGLDVPDLRPGAHAGLVLVQWDLPVGQILTMGHIVLIPRVHSHDDPILDRVYTAKLAWALGQIWFGQTVWANEDKETWLPSGLSGYLALEFFESLWGWDARIHTIVDWLNPRYRENFLETPVRNLMMGNEDAPLLISITNYPFQQSALVATSYKAVLILRMLSFVTGTQEFDKGLRGFFLEFSHRTADHTEFQRTMGHVAGRSLDWFFSDWFEGHPRLDYSIVDWTEVFSETTYGVVVEVRRTGVLQMPVDIEVTDVLGAKTVARFDGVSETGKVYIPLQAEPATIRLDPQEFLIETDRRNNLSSPQIRFRPFYDWSKQSEVLVTLQGRIGGNAIDGNYAGLGVAVPLSETTSIEAIPIYGERTQWANYELTYTRERFLIPRLTFSATASKLEGTTGQAATLAYGYLTPDWIHADSSATFALADVTPSSRESGDRVLVQGAGQDNNIALGSDLGFRWNAALRSSIGLSAEHSESGYGSRFTYTRLDAVAGQGVQFNPNHSFNLTLVRSGIEGQAPIQKEILIAGPGLLRGYPRTLNFVNDQAAGARASYEATIARGVWGGAIQVRKVGVILFGDIAKGWDNHQSPEQVRQRQDVGIGLDIRVNALSFVEFPIRVDIAQPVNDPQYHSPQIILFEALAFF